MNEMHIEKYTALVKDTTTKKTFKVVVDENTSHEAHKKVLSKLTYYQDIVKIHDFENNLVYDADRGFI